MILNKYIIIPLLFILSFFNGIDVQAQNHTVLIFDPFQVSGNFQNSFHQLSQDSLFISNSIDENINNFDALFLFIAYPYLLNQSEGILLTAYLQSSRPIYIYTKLLFQEIDVVNLWKIIGIDWYAELTTTVLVDSIIGIDTEFTNNIVIDSTFFSPHIPHAEGNLVPILNGCGSPMNIDVAYISGNDSLNIIIDQYHQIYHPEFLERVLIHFGLKNPNSISDENYDQPNTFYLSQNYPNPFNPTTKIKFTIPQSVILSGAKNLLFAQLKVYDVLGNEIATLFNEEKTAGSYEVEFDATGLASGIYYYQLQAGSFVETKKMVLLR